MVFIFHVPPYLKNSSIHASLSALQACLTVLQGIQPRMENSDQGHADRWDNPLNCNTKFCWHKPLSSWPPWPKASSWSSTNALPLWTACLSGKRWASGFDIPWPPHCQLQSPNSQQGWLGLLFNFLFFFFFDFMLILSIVRSPCPKVNKNQIWNPLYMRPLA